MLFLGERRLQNNMQWNGWPGDLMEDKITQTCCSSWPTAIDSEKKIQTWRNLRAKNRFGGPLPAKEGIMERAQLKKSAWHCFGCWQLISGVPSPAPAQMYRETGKLLDRKGCRVNNVEEKAFSDRRRHSWIFCACRSFQNDFVLPWIRPKTDIK